MGDNDKPGGPESSISKKTLATPDDDTEGQALRGVVDDPEARGQTGATHKNLAIPGDDDDPAAGPDELARR